MPRLHSAKMKRMRCSPYSYDQRQLVKLRDVVDTNNIGMATVTSKLTEIMLMVAPEGMIDDDDRD